jgi:hypothetical protein
MNTKIVRTPGWMSYRRERKKIEYKDSINNKTDAKEKCRKRIRNPVDGVAPWPNRRAGHHTSNQRSAIILIFLNSQISLFSKRIRQL